MRTALESQGRRESRQKEKTMNPRRRRIARARRAFSHVQPVATPRTILSCCDACDEAAAGILDADAVRRHFACVNPDVRLPAGWRRTGIKELTDCGWEEEICPLHA